MGWWRERGGAGFFVLSRPLAPGHVFGVGRGRGTTSLPLAGGYSKCVGEGAAYPLTHWAVDSWQWTVCSGEWAVDTGQWTVGEWTVGEWAVDSGQCQQWTVSSG